METLTQPFSTGRKGGLLEVILKKKKATYQKWPNCYWYHEQKGALENQGELLLQELLCSRSRENCWFWRGTRSVVTVAEQWLLTLEVVCGMLIIYYDTCGLIKVAACITMPPVLGWNLGLMHKEFTHKTNGWKKTKRRGPRAASLPESCHDCEVWGPEGFLSIVFFWICQTRAIQSYTEFKSLGTITSSTHKLLKAIIFPLSKLP